MKTFFFFLAHYVNLSFKLFSLFVAINTMAKQTFLSVLEQKLQTIKKDHKKAMDRN